MTTVIDLPLTLPQLKYLEQLLADHLNFQTSARSVMMTIDCTPFNNEPDLGYSILEEIQGAVGCFETEAYSSMTEGDDLDDQDDPGLTPNTTSAG
jgi:hypothetical protein